VEYTLSQVEEMSRQLEEAEAMAAQEKSTLPDAGDLNATTDLITEAYMGFWNA
jgi:hypothetical protein